MAWLATFGIRTGDEVVRVSGKLSERFAANPTTRSVGVVDGWIDAILNPPKDDGDGETGTTGETGETGDKDEANGHDLGAVASPTYATAAGLITDAVTVLRLLSGDELVTATDDDRAALAANRDELDEELTLLGV